MENSEIQQKVILLGKALVNEMGLEPGVDTLSRWLAHYIAEQLTYLENAKEDEKKLAQDRCFETILKVWQHRSLYPNNHRPFQNFEGIFKTLTALNQKSRYTYYGFYDSKPNLELANSNKDLKQWTDITIRIDNAARNLINFALRQAVEKALDDKTKNWLDKAINLMPNDDLIAINQLTSKDDSIEKLETMLKQLNEFIELSQFIRNEISEAIQQNTSKKVQKDSNL